MNHTIPCLQTESIESLLAGQLAPDGRIGSYEVVGMIGRGGMGVVFKGFDAALNRYVAIKTLLPHLAASGAARKRFAREAQAAAAVVDDHVMPIHFVAEWQGVPYFVMPYTRDLPLTVCAEDLSEQKTQIRHQRISSASEMTSSSNLFKFNPAACSRTSICCC